MAIITSTINAHVYIEIQDNLLIPSIENWFGDDEIIFQENNAPCHRAKGSKAFFQERHIKINNVANEQSGSKFSWTFIMENLKNVQGSSNKEDLFTAIQEDWNPFSYRFKFFGLLVGFYGISTLEGYFIQNFAYAFILNIYDF